MMRYRPSSQIDEVKFTKEFKRIRTGFLRARGGGASLRFQRVGRGDGGYGRGG